MMGFFGKSKSSQPEKTHPALRLKAEMDKDAVIGLLGRDYRSTTRGPLEYWLYSSDRYDIEIIFRSGALKSAEVKKKADGKKVGATTVVHWAESDQGEGEVEADIVRIVNGRPVHVPGTGVRFVNGHPVPVPERPESQEAGMTTRAKPLTSRPTTPDYPGELDRLNTDKVEALVHFLDDKPLAVCFEHRGSSACLGYSATPFGTLLRADSAEPFSDDCPLCRSGDKPEFYSVYNVVVMAQSQGPKFSASAIIMGETRPFRRPTLKLWFDPGVGSLYGTIDQARKQYGKLNDPDVYCWVTKNGVYPMTADHMAGEEWRTQPLTWAERHELSSAKWSNESVPNALGILPRMTLRRPDRRT